MTNPLSANFQKWSKALKQCKLLSTNCLCVFDHFMGLPLKGLTKIFVILYSSFTGYIELELESRKMFHLTLRKRPSNAEDRVLGEKKT